MQRVIRRDRDRYGIGGAITARRPTQAGLRICVLGRGRRYESPEPEMGEEPESDFPQLTATDRIARDIARRRRGADQGLWDVLDAGDARPDACAADAAA